MLVTCKNGFFLLCLGSPPLGSRGTVVGVHEGALEVLFDVDFIGGGDLQGRCQGRCGIMLPPADLLNLAKPHFINLQGNLILPRQLTSFKPNPNRLDLMYDLTISPPTSSKSVESPTLMTPQSKPTLATGDIQLHPTLLFLCMSIS